jgi:hypothetical protein
MNAWPGAINIKSVVPVFGKPHLYREGEWFVRLTSVKNLEWIEPAWEHVDKLDALDKSSAPQ